MKWPFADRHGRARIIPARVVLTGMCALLLAAPFPLIAVQAAIVTLLLNFDLTQPLLTGIVTSVLPVTAKEISED